MSDNPLLCNVLRLQRGRPLACPSGMVWHLPPTPQA